MTFEDKFVFTALNAEELKIGSRVYVANEIGTLRDYVNGEVHIATVSNIRNDSYEHRIIVRFDSDLNTSPWAFAYLVSPPEEKKLKWTDLKIGDVIHKKHEPHLNHMVIGMDMREDAATHILINETWIFDSELATYEKSER